MKHSIPSPVLSDRTVQSQPMRRGQKSYKNFPSWDFPGGPVVETTRPLQRVQA